MITFILKASALGFAAHTKLCGLLIEAHVSVPLFSQIYHCRKYFILRFNFVTMKIVNENSVVF